MPADVDTDILVAVAEDSEIPVTTLWYALAEGRDTGKELPPMRLERAVDEARRRQRARERQSTSRGLRARLRDLVDSSGSDRHA
jgi:hypothetical protein